jgi:hypothetical protein
VNPFRLLQGTVRWTGRLPADLLATVPMDQECWWLELAGEGAAFNCHPLPACDEDEGAAGSGGGGGGGGSAGGCDVAWQALASANALAVHGLTFDPNSGRVVRAAGPAGTTAGGGGPPASGRPGGGKGGGGLRPVVVEDPLFTGHALMSPLQGGSSARSQRGPAAGAVGNGGARPAGHEGLGGSGDEAALAALAAAPWVSVTC